MKRQFWAHSHPSQREPNDKWQPLCVHLRNVADLAERLAASARPNDKAFAQTARLAGLLHDLGKYRPGFQRHIIDNSMKGRSTWHKQVGAACVFDKLKGRPDIAWAILGHHGELQDRENCKKIFINRYWKDAYKQIWSDAVQDCPSLEQFERDVSTRPRVSGELELDLSIRLLFSCLVDADWLDTAGFYRKAAGLEEVPPAEELDPAERLKDVLQFIEERAKACPNAQIASIRKEILDASLESARQAEAPGLFSMTVPTGGGKTLSALAFALEHAGKLDLRRIIYVAPYLSIIEQNARVFRQALRTEGRPGFLLEHHSMSEPTSSDYQESKSADRLAENWDAPVVITTSVQFFESLFSNKPGRCRKIHNIARSVVILDECQTLPPGLISPTCSMLDEFSKVADCSIILCTATQPAWNRREDFPEGLEDIIEIVPTELNLFERLRRVQVTWPEPHDEPWDFRKAVSVMLERPAALCVVNTKKKAREMFQSLKGSTDKPIFHLSTLMCPKHRLMVIDEVKRLLSVGRAVYLVSTQLIEAGVDLDFPCVLREIAPLESIVQAAGRCNREGNLNRQDGAPGGEVIVFRFRTTDRIGLPPDLWYRSGIDTLEQNFLALGRRPDLSNPEQLNEYFRRLYHSGELDAHEIQNARKRLNFPEVARKYRLIDNDNMTPVVVASWEQTRQEVEELLSQLENQLDRRIYRKLEHHQVNIYNRQLDSLKEAGAIDFIEGIADIYIYRGRYDEMLGIDPEGEVGNYFLL